MFCSLAPCALVSFDSFPGLGVLDLLAKLSTLSLSENSLSAFSSAFFSFDSVLKRSSDVEEIHERDISLAVPGQIMNKRMAALTKRLKVFGPFGSEIFVAEMMKLKAVLFPAQALPRKALLVFSSRAQPVGRAQVVAVAGKAQIAELLPH